MPETQSSLSCVGNSPAVPAFNGPTGPRTPALLIRQMRSNLATSSSESHQFKRVIPALRSTKSRRKLNEFAVAFFCFSGQRVYRLSLKRHNRYLGRRLARAKAKPKPREAPVMIVMVFISVPLYALLEAGFYKLFQIAVKNSRGVSSFYVGTQIFNS